MSSYSGTGDFHIYDSFVEIKDHSFRSVVRFYEANFSQIQQLPLGEYIELLHEYLNALFELSHYRKYLQNCDELIELSFQHNIVKYEDEDLLQTALLRKAACHYHIYQTDTALRITKELLKISPGHKSARMLYEKCLMRKHKSYVHITRGIAIILLLSSAIVVSVELLLVRPFYDHYVNLIEFIRNLFFIGGLIILTVGETYSRGTTWLSLQKFLKDVNKKKSQKDNSSLNL